MTDLQQQELIRKLAAVWELSPEVRFGQLLSHLGFLADDRHERGLGDIEDDEMLAVFEEHRAELSRREAQAV